MERPVESHKGRERYEKRDCFQHRDRRDYCDPDIRVSPRVIQRPKSSCLWTGDIAGSIGPLVVADSVGPLVVLV